MTSQCEHTRHSKYGKPFHAGRGITHRRGRQSVDEYENYGDENREEIDTAWRQAFEKVGVLNSPRIIAGVRYEAEPEFSKSNFLKVSAEFRRILAKFDIPENEIDSYEAGMEQAWKHEAAIRIYGFEW
jgi:hypothetical protein